MRTLAIIISMIIAAGVAVYISVALGALIALACVLYQLILGYSRSITYKSVNSAMFWGVIVRNGVFLIPLGAALLSNVWLVAAATVVVFAVNLLMS